MKHTVLRVPLESDDYEIKVMVAGHVVDAEHIVIDTRKMRGAWKPLLPSEFRYNVEEGDFGEGFGDRCRCCGRSVAAAGEHQVVAGSQAGRGALSEPHLSGMRDAFETLRATIVELRAELQRLERGAHGS